MIWLTWRQFRPQAITTGVILLALGITLAVTGPGLVSSYNAAGLGTCHATCSALAGHWLNDIKHGTDAVLYYTGIPVMYLAPALIGMFWGAPLIARELEAGTFRLAWNQSVTRRHWAAIKLGLIGLAAITTTGLMSLMITWWAGPVDHALNTASQNSPVTFTRMSPLVFGARGIVPLGYAAFAFALGVTAGVILRRTLPAMAITLAIFAAVQVLVPNFVRPYLIPASQVTAPLRASATSRASIEVESVQGATTGVITVTGSFTRPGAWILSNTSITPSGQVLTVAPRACLGNAPAQECTNWLASQHLRQRVSFQPASRFWPLQFLEAAVYLILAAALGWVCVRQVRRKRS
jgi:ABC-2 family transporter protein